MSYHKKMKDNHTRDHSYAEEEEVLVEEARQDHQD
jgi:hypothetical protein